ncbi:Cytochrome P450 724B1 [Vitis vinifera]|uniref:Cytochrome P450 724B1 n=1 Tax=Vitis vinifera TaxID=29760 RepID=A0A438JHC5_VITVI|nr:Cytochrome P450 724B1 [Vitis vinifera]
MAVGFWFVLLVGLVGLVLGLILNHFLPLFFKLGHVPKGTFGWPLLGETLCFLKPHPSNSLGAFLQDRCSRFGKVFKSHLFFSPTVLSKAHPWYSRKISMLVAVGDTHKRLRNVALSLVTTTKTKPEFLNEVERAAIRVLDSWKDKPQIIFCEEARKFTFNVIVKQVLGLTPDDPQTAKILQDFLTFMRGLISLPLYIPGTPYARAVQARIRISSTVKAIIEERRRDAENSSKRDDFLEILLCVDTLSEDEKVSFVLDSLLGGYETTSLLMALAVHFLLEHQKIRSMKQKDDYLNWDDYKRMDFTQNVIHEALRCGNVVKFVHRKALKDVKFRDYLIPSGWKVLPVFSAVHLDPSLHASALQFHPWRWEGRDQTCKKFTPFGGGSRCCPGSELAKIQVAFFLHHLVQNFRWNTKDGDQPFAYPYVEFQRGLALNLDHCST